MQVKSGYLLCYVSSHQEESSGRCFRCELGPRESKFEWRIGKKILNPLGRDWFLCFLVLCDVIPRTPMRIVWKKQYFEDKRRVAEIRGGVIAWDFANYPQKQSESHAILNLEIIDKENSFNQLVGQSLPSESILFNCIHNILQRCWTKAKLQTKQPKPLPSQHHYYCTQWLNSELGKCRNQNGSTPHQRHLVLIWTQVGGACCYHGERP